MSTSDWLCCQLLAPSSLILPGDRGSIGMFELTRAIDPLPGCETALLQSAAAFGESIDPKRSFLLKTFFLEAEAVRHVIRSARLYAREALGLHAKCLMLMHPLRLMRSGYLVDMSNLAVAPLLPSAQEQTLRQMGTVAVVDEQATHPREIVDRLLVSNPTVFGELGAAIRRSTHWSELAQRQEDDGERFLFQWMACETLTRIDENECLTPKLMSGLGLPTARYFAELPTAERTALQRSPGYLRWRTRLNDLFDKLRDLRNHIAHSGYRELEIAGHLTDEQHRLAGKVLPMVVSRLQDLALVGLESGAKTIAQLWMRYVECKLRRRPISLAAEVDGTIVYLIEESLLDE